MVPLGQLRDTFIIAIDSEGLLIVDQHVAHERILYEQVLERLTSRRAREPAPADAARARPVGRRRSRRSAAAASDLERLGFEVEPFGDRTVHVAAVPAIVKVEAAAAAIRALADDLDGRDRGAPVDVAIKHLAATIACHAAVKAHDPLTPEKMQYLLDELRRTAYSTICPHGRPGAAASHAPRDRARVRSRVTRDRRTACASRAVRGRAEDAHEYIRRDCVFSA